MTCEEAELLLAGGHADASVENHLRFCANCRALEEEMAANALALHSLRDAELPGLKLRKRQPARPWIAAAAAAALLVLIAHQASERRPVVVASLHPRTETTPASVTETVKAFPKPAPKIYVRRKPKSVPRSTPPAEPLLVKMLTSDPDVVVYWVVD